MMKKNKSACDEEVKCIFKNYSHRKCTSAKTRQYCRVVTGAVLNNYLLHQRDTATDPKRFNPRKQYNVCHNLHCVLTKPANNDSTNCKETPPIICPVIDARNADVSQRTTITPDEDNNVSRAQRLFLRNRIKDVLDSYYKVPFGNLCMRERRRRMGELSRVVLGACIERGRFKKDSDEYMYKNKKLVVDAINLLDGMKEYILSKTKGSIRTTKYLSAICVCASVVEEWESCRELSLVLDGMKEYILSKTKVDENELDSVAVIPSSTKDRPKIVPLLIQPMERIDSTVTNENERDGGENEEFLNFEEMQSYPDEYELELALRRLSQQKELIGAKIDGGYAEYMNLMMKKHMDKGRMNIDGNDGGQIVIDSIDGAEHRKSKTDITSIISFSSMMFVSDMIQTKEVTAGSSLNILTWQQVRGTETLHTMMPAVKEYFEEKKAYREIRRNDFFYDLHDGKMLYLLTQHSAWNRKYKPFLLCNCLRGEGVTGNEEHRCVKISHENQIVSYQRSRRRWDLKTRRDQSYTLKKHMDWIDQNNNGISHFGLHPDLLPRDGIRFDTFHMKCALTRKLIGYLRKILLNQSTDINDNFCSEVLRKFWNDYHLYVWRNKKNFSSFVGNEIAIFVANIGLIQDFFQENLVQTNEIKDFMKALGLWRKIFKFLSITYIERNTYLNKMEQFEVELKRFYDVGSRTFLSTHGTENGMEETFYCHALRYYIPDITRVTYERHSLGVGIFNMQGFERRNKESKNCMKRFSNNKGNIVVNNMKRLWDVFRHEVNAV
eukprot:CAMPEP_0203712330 /NCGR_PEP_ID=MMETSP0091-20130426/69973_1 /ASSEMBLY_ACC=CAM_ASM_001089 /TAXON_ID=426623 /ORGANISM="Chaetoceros affinis, Strain CCMP159" /LENGTH=776 /DNA_ID=CAMNT_0050590301 /DNA_START=350 /DNA_END=2681 /DNA_ORIENTATION=-